MEQQISRCTTSKVKAFVVAWWPDRDWAFIKADLLFQPFTWGAKVCAACRMLVFPVFQLLLLACTAGWSRALRSHGRSVARHARAVSDNQLEVFATTAIPNHLPEEKFSLLTSAQFLTTPEDSVTNMVTNTVAPVPKTMAPTLQNSTKLNISLPTTFTSTPSYPQNITTTATTDFTTTTTTTTTTTITTLDFTTKKGNFDLN